MNRAKQKEPRALPVGIYIYYLMLKTNISPKRPVDLGDTKPLGELVKEEVGEIVREAESQITGAKEPDEEKKRVEVEEKEQEQLAAARRRLKEIREESAAARQGILQEQEENRRVREEGIGDIKREKEKFSFAAPHLPPETASKPKSHLPPQVGVEKRTRR